MNGGAQARIFMPVVEQDFAVAQEIVLFKSGRCQDRFRVEEAGQLRK